MYYTLKAIHEQIGGELLGNGDERITGINAIETATPGDVIFAEHERYLPLIRTTLASAILVPKQFPSVPEKNLLKVDSPRAAFVKIMHLFQPPNPTPSGVHRSAEVSPSATIGNNVTLAEGVVVRDEAKIGDNTVVESGVHVGRGVVIGRQCQIGPNVVLMYGTRLSDRVIIHGGTVVGGDGFGYVWAGKHVKIPQLGNVIIEDDVEIGCNVCVDRATFGSTVIRRGTKIDNLVQIAHNDSIGEDVIMAGQVGLSGSVTVGNRAMFGGQSGAVDHVKIGQDARIGAATPVTKDVKAGDSVWGFPARPVRRVKREMATVSLLPEIVQQVRACTAEIERLRAKIQALESERPSAPMSTR